MFENFDLMYNVDTLYAIVIKVLVVLFVFLMMGAFVGFSDAINARIKKGFSKVDSHPFALWFGKTPIGKELNQELLSLASNPPDLSDEFNKMVANLGAAKWLLDAGQIDAKTFGTFLKQVIETGVKLTNGVPDVEVSILPTDGGSSIKMK